MENRAAFIAGGVEESGQLLQYRVLKEEFSKIDSAGWGGGGLGPPT